MDFHQLRVFRAAARLGGFTRAGEDLRLSQSTVSLHIKQLEELLGAELFLRIGKRVYLNEAGKTLLQYSDKIFNEIKNAEMAVHELSTLRRGLVRLGVGATTLIYLMPKILAAYQRKYPEIELVVTTGLSEVLAQAVHAQTLDMAIVMLPIPTNLSIEILPILREELVCVLNAHHPLVAKEILTPRDLDGARFIGFLQESSMQSQLDKYLAAMNTRPHITMELENIEAIKALVRGGLGMAVLPQSSVAGAQGAMLRIRRIHDFPMERHLGLALPKSSTLPLAIKKLAARIVRGIAGKSSVEIG